MMLFSVVFFGFHNVIIAAFVSSTVLGIVFAGAAVAVVMFGAKDYLRFILPHFWESVAVAAVIIGFAWILLNAPKWKNWVKYAIIGLVVAVAVIIG